MVRIKGVEFTRIGYNKYMEEFKKAYYELVKEHGFEIIPQITLGVRKIEVVDTDQRSVVSKEEVTGTVEKITEPTSEVTGTE